MYEAQLHLQQDKPCVLSQAAHRTADPLKVDLEELHDDKITFVLHADDHADEIERMFEAADEVLAVERLDEDTIGATKHSCGAYDAIYENNGVLRRHSSIAANERAYNVLLFDKSDLRSIVGEFRDIGEVTVERLTQVGEDEPKLTDRQREVIEAALHEGYFEWPRRIDSEELADQLGISRATCLEHLRKAEEKLLRDALNSPTRQTEGERPSLASL